MDLSLQANHSIDSATSIVYRMWLQLHTTPPLTGWQKHLIR